MRADVSEVYRGSYGISGSRRTQKKSVSRKEQYVKLSILDEAFILLGRITFFTALIALVWCLCLDAIYTAVAPVVSGVLFMVFTDIRVTFSVIIVLAIILSVVFTLKYDK